jgi:signal transduction histidine kinase/CheY-like chemotaxis protein/HPt (histidine-containing phosphotransfer) domain-containing protein
MSSFTLFVGLIGFLSLTAIGDSAVKATHNVRILNDIYDYNVAVHAGVHQMLYLKNPVINKHILSTTKEYTEALLNDLSKYLEIQDQFSEFFTPGQMQDMANIFEVYKETYIAVLYEIFNLVERGKWEEAASISKNRLDPIHKSISYNIDMAFERNLRATEIKTAQNSENAAFRAYFMLAVVVFALIASVLMALFVTRSIAVPLAELEAVTAKVAGGDLNVQLDHTKGDDEIAHLSLRFSEMIKQLNQIQQLKFETMAAQYEREKAEASSRSKGEFLAKMSHEIRTPMNAIIGMAELTLRKDIPPAAYENVFVIKQASVNLLSIINDILDLSKIESGKLEIVPVNYLFSSLINDVVNIIKLRAIDSQLKFTVNTDSSAPNALFGDEVRFRQALINVLINAVKYTKKGYVALSIHSEIISSDIVNIFVEVADTGIGIKKENIDKLFSDFVQIDLENTRDIEGTGLGLVITRNIINAMGGSISVRSEYGKGSVFTIALPQKFINEDKLAAVENPEQKSVLIYEPREIYARSIVSTVDNLGVKCAFVSTNAEFYEKMSNGNWPFVFVASSLLGDVKKICSDLDANANIVLLAEFGETTAEQNAHTLVMPVYSTSVANILNGVTGSFLSRSGHESTTRFTAPEAKVIIVDDIYTNLKVAEGLLSPYKMQVTLCKSAFEAIEEIKKARYDLVFMDHMMPEMDGIEATLYMRTLGGEYYRTLPIIALTANATYGTREMFLQNSFNDFLPKPIDTVKLNELLEKWIPKQKQKKDDHHKRAAGREDTAQTAIVVEGLDIERGIVTTGGTTEGYLEVLDVFYKDGIDKIKEIRSCLAQNNLSLYTINVHALKSACANIGATELSNAARDLEEAGRQENLTFIVANTPKLLADLELVLKNIHTVIASTEKDLADIDTLKTSLAKLKTAIIAIDPRLINKIVKEIQQFKLSGNVETIDGDIVQNTLICEYDEAVSMIDDILQKE